MQSYLSGYLSVLPLIQRKRIVELLKNNEDYKYNVISNAELNALIEQIIEEHKQATEYTPQQDQFDSQRYNDFFGKVYTDLHFMFNESDLIDRALSNYNSLSSAELSNINKKVSDLRTQINNLKAVSAGENGLIVKTETFQTSASEEDPDGTYANLFCDRDGALLPKASINLNNRKKILSLKMNQVIDRIHDSNGLLNAEVELLDQRGYSEDQNEDELKKIIDGSSDTHWGVVVYTDDEVNMDMYGVKGPGAMSKLCLTFDSPIVASEVSLTPFGIYPSEVAAILYEQEVEYTAEGNTVPPNQRYLVASEEMVKENPDIEMLVDGKECVSSDTIVFSFPNTLIKRMILILKQRNFESIDETLSDWEREKQVIWKILSSNISEEDEYRERFNLYLKSTEKGDNKYVR